MAGAAAREGMERLEATIIRSVRSGGLNCIYLSMTVADPLRHTYLPCTHRTPTRSGLLKTNAKYRPSPSLFYFPGLTSRPFHNPKLFPWVQT